MDAMPQRLIVDDEDLIVNPERRLACVNLADVSTSMDGAPRDQLNRGIQVLYHDLSCDPVASKRVEICPISFGPVTIEHDFSTVNHVRAPVFQAGNETPLGEAIMTALKAIEARKAVYDANGISRYRPWIIAITDGCPTDDWKAAAKALAEAERKKQVAAFFIGVEGADFGILKQISVRPPIKLSGLHFPSLFQWLSTSLRSASRSQIGQTQMTAPLPNTMQISQ